jgi:peptide/nickel transport system substrate-binding protein
LALALALALSACGGDSGSGSASGDTGASGGSGGTFVFGSSADPVILDGAYVSDGESLRVIRQIFEGLVTTAEGSTDIEPALAESWQASDDGLTWTFTLRQGVKFHDGTDFNGEAVCANFDRWYNFSGIQQADSVSYYWTTVFGGFKANEDPNQGASLYSSCAAPDAGTAVITLTKPSSTFLSALSLPSFAIASPTALTEYKADEVGGTAESPSFTGTFGTEHPIGTGPFMFDSWVKGDKLTLKAYPEYWGDKAKLDTLIFRPIADGPARRQALEAGDIDGYDQVDPADIEALKGSYEVLERPAFNVAYVGFNQKIKPLDDIKVRQAIAYALNRQQLITTQYPPGAVVAKEFMPPDVFGYADDVTEYSYDPEKAKQLLAEAGVPNPTVEFWYPSGVSRPYMPNPTANFQLFKADLEAVGFTVVPKTAPWNPDYLDATDSGKAAIYLLGWTGDFGDPDNFIGTFFQAPLAQFGFDNPEIFTLLDQAEAEPDEAKRTEMYQEANRKIMDFLPGVPYAHTSPYLAFKPTVKGFVPSPVNNEDFNTVTIE